MNFTGPIVANIVLADEINRATPRTQSSLLEVMEERQVTIDGISVKVDDPFMVIATQNPVEAQQGTFSLPVAQMDRFFMKLTMEYPSLESEKEILKQARGIGGGQKTEAVLSHEEIKKLKDLVQQVKINDTVESYLLQIVRKTRQHPEIDLGVSPRGALALMKAAQGQAFLENRDYVIPKDIKMMVPYVLGHRIILSTEASFTKSPERVLKEVLEAVPVPVEMGA